MPYGKRGRVGGGNGNSPSSIQSSKPVYEATKSISYGAVSNQIYSRFIKMDKNLMKTPLQTINKSIWKDKYSNSTTNLSLKLLYLAVLLSFPLCNLVLHIVEKS